MEPHMKTRIVITLIVLGLDVLPQDITKVLKELCFFTVTNGFPSKIQYSRTSSCFIAA